MVLSPNVRDQSISTRERGAGGRNGRPPVSGVAGAAAGPDMHNPILPPVVQMLPLALLRTREAMMIHFRPALRARGLTEQQWRVLRVLEEEPLDATTIAERVCLLAPSLSRILKGLVDLGMVERIRTSRGPRRRRIALTEKGRALIEELAPEMSREHARLRARLGDDYDALRDLLARVERALTPPG